MYIQLNFPAKPLWYEGKSGPLQRGRGVNVINFGRQRWLILIQKCLLQDSDMLDIINSGLLSVICTRVDVSKNMF